MTAAETDDVLISLAAWLQGFDLLQMTVPQSVQDDLEEWRIITDLKLKTTHVEQLPYCRDILQAKTKQMINHNKWWRQFRFNLHNIIKICTS